MEEREKIGDECSLDRLYNVHCGLTVAARFCKILAQIVEFQILCRN